MGLSNIKAWEQKSGAVLNDELTLGDKDAGSRSRVTFWGKIRL